MQSFLRLAVQLATKFQWPARTLTKSALFLQIAQETETDRRTAAFFLDMITDRTEHQNPSEDRGEVSGGEGGEGCGVGGEIDLLVNRHRDEKD